MKASASPASTIPQEGLTGFDSVPARSPASPLLCPTENPFGWSCQMGSWEMLGVSPSSRGGQGREAEGGEITHLWLCVFAQVPCPLWASCFCKFRDTQTGVPPGVPCLPILLSPPAACVPRPVGRELGSWLSRGVGASPWDVPVRAEATDRSEDGGSRGGTSRPSGM